MTVDEYLKLLKKKYQVIESAPLIDENLFTPNINLGERLNIREGKVKKQISKKALKKNPDVFNPPFK